MMSENVEYKESYIAFLDVLGFKAIVMNQDVKGNLNVLDDYFKEVDRLREYFDGLSFHIEIIAISDSIIISIPRNISDESDIGNLRHLCIAVAIFQCMLAKLNIWLRGGISNGKTYFNSKKAQVVGPGYIRAYELEEKYAKWPRVILDPALIKLHGFSSADDFIEKMNVTDSKEKEAHQWDGNVLFNWKYSDGTLVETIIKDVPLFIDYMSYYCEMDREGMSDIASHLKDNIYMNNDIYPKYRWVADYLRAKLYECNLIERPMAQDVQNVLLSI